MMIEADAYLQQVHVKHSESKSTDDVSISFENVKKPKPTDHYECCPHN